MKIQLLIASSDSDYSGHLSDNLAENHADVIDVAVCSTVSQLRDYLETRKFDVALLDETMIENTELISIRLPLLLWSDTESAQAVAAGEFNRIRKYQRISSLVSNILELFAKVTASENGMYSKRARITAIWSPMGGVGKTTAALAFSEGKASAGKQVLYLNLEQFSSNPAYFSGTGKSISAVFEMLETSEGNIRMLIRSILQKDRDSDITYFCRPENFDDMNILTAENIGALIEACSEMTEELVIDMSCACDERTRKVFELADRIFIVTDQSGTAQIKYSQFVSQHSIFQRISDKTTLVANKGAAIGEPYADAVIFLPLIQSADEATVYKALSVYDFE